MSNETVYHPGEIDWAAPGKRQYDVAFHLDSSWGYSLLPVTVINGLKNPGTGKMPPGVAVFGGNHGNEWEGQIAVKRLCSDLDALQLSGRIILIPQLSPSACAANTRLSPLDNVNMNRAFPGNPRGSISYRIAHFVTSHVFPLARIVVDLHSGGVEGGFALCTSIHSVPDPNQYEEMVGAAKLFDTPFVFVYSSDMASGLLSDEAESNGKITIGGEFGFGETVSRIGVRHATEGIKNVLRFYGHLAEPVIKIDNKRAAAPQLVSATDLNAYQPAPQDGIWEPAVDLGDTVAAGTAIGYIHDFSNQAAPPLEIRANTEGILIMMHAPAACARGVTLYVIASPV
ncbi:MAG TPA: succinylglutamate desuccinylase/aspartoacylase family protein [Bryobacteraceae bacterium]|nr:succinylglutamate desuccinylase/aspartoacylase family protein [Bryobacteraceae bacterium]